MTGPAAAEGFVVLVLEADRGEATRLSQLLSRSFDVVVSHTAAEAFAVLRTRSAHVICSDYKVPGMNAVQFLQRALRLKDPPCLLFIADGTDARDKSLDGLSGAMVRPYDEKALVDRVSRLCQVAETRRKVQSARESILAQTSSGKKGAGTPEPE